MHHSRLCAVLIDCRTSDVDAAARFWGEALGRPGQKWRAWRSSARRWWTAWSAGS